jgi:hypothetical protein
LHLRTTSCFSAKWTKDRHLRILFEYRSPLVLRLSAGLGLAGRQPGSGSLLIHMEV